MTESGPTLVYAPEVKYENQDKQNWTDDGHSLSVNISYANGRIIFNVILFAICFLGLLGNGKVIWILGFHMKRNFFSIYILNLAVADFGVLMMQILKQISQNLSQNNSIAYFIFFLTSFVFYNASQVLLISISVDRCVSVHFPIWNKCHRPPKLSLIVCAVAWVLPIVLFGLEMVAIISKTFLLVQIIFNSLISYPVVIISTLILLVKIFWKQRQLKRGKVLKITLLALMCFIVFRLPLTILSIIIYNILKKIDLTGLIETLLENSAIENIAHNFPDILDSIHIWGPYIDILLKLPTICIAVNSSINPILYFLAGTNKEARSMQHALQRVFRNEENCMDDKKQPNET